MVWNKHLNNDIKNWLSNKFKINEVDKYVYVKNIDKCYVIVCLYMDDMLILNNNDHMIKFTKKILTNKFDIKKLGYWKCHIRNTNFLDI